MSSVGYGECIEELSDETRDMHVLMEELEAVDCCNQSGDACKYMELKADARIRRYRRLRDARA